MSSNRPFFPLDITSFPSSLFKDITLAIHLYFNFFLTAPALIIVLICCDFPQSGKQFILTLLRPPAGYFYIKKKKKTRKKSFVYEVSGSYSSILSVGLAFKMHLLSDMYHYHPGPSNYHLSLGFQAPLSWSCCFICTSAHFIPNTDVSWMYPVEL